MDVGLITLVLYRYVIAFARARQYFYVVQLSGDSHYCSYGAVAQLHDSA